MSTTVPRRAADILARLTPEMRPVSQLMAEGLTSGEIADHLGRTMGDIEVTICCFRGRFADLIGYQVSRAELTTFLRNVLIGWEAAE